MNQAVSTRTPASPRLLYAIVMVTGAAVMILELLGTRLIGPFYGVSLYVWSSLIAVTLIALAAGYFLGGYLADRVSSLRLSHIIAFSAFTTILIPFLNGPVLRMTDHLGLRVGAFISALILFLLPLTALAMVGPYVIKRTTHDLGGVGTIAGSVYAVSTVGSVAGTLLLGFYLLPEFGTKAIISALSLSLGASALAVAWHERSMTSPSRLLIVLPVLAATVGIGAAAGGTVPATNVEGFTIRSETESLYGWVRVVDDNRHGYRLMLSDASVLSAVDLNQNRSLLGYQEIIGLLPTVHRTATRALLIGLGGGHVARDLETKGIVTDTIEIDPAVAEGARRWFHFEPTGLFLVGDARHEIKQLPGRYDLIIHDCFTGGAEPTHLLTQEMMRELRGLLNEHGILALNYVGFRTGEGSEAVAAVYRTIKTVFPHLKAFVTDQADFTDFIFLASEHPLAIGPSFDDLRVQWLVNHEHQFMAAEGFVITDDYNPMESRQVRKAETYRKHFIERVAFDLLLR
ncbi:fused MFS/spermidine synthase [Nitrospira sp. CMX1]|nr:fused MFS/spermidine synthase [Nitrospira sp.]